MTDLLPGASASLPAYPVPPAPVPSRRRRGPIPFLVIVVLVAGSLAGAVWFGGELRDVLRPKGPVHPSARHNWWSPGPHASRPVQRVIAPCAA